jgi:hypothetical protein
MVLKPGKLDLFDNFVDPDCMARFMEDAMPPPPTQEDSGKRGRREFLIAIASGVIAYLRQHQTDGFTVRDLNSANAVARIEIN